MATTNTYQGVVSVGITFHNTQQQQVQNNRTSSGGSVRKLTNNYNGLDGYRQPVPVKQGGR